MKSGSDRKNDNSLSPVQRMPEGDSLSKVMAPPPLSFSDPVQAKADESALGESAFDEGEKQTGPGLMQMKKAPDAAGAGDDKGAEGDTLQLQPQQQQQQQQNSGPDDMSVGDVEQGNLDQEMVEQEIAIPGAFDISNGPQAFHDYILAPIRSAFTSNTFNVKLSFNINLGIKAEVLKGLFGIGGGGMFGVEVFLNRQDDRLVRGGWAISYGAQLVSDILWFIQYTREWVGKSSTTAVFRDMFHFAAVCYDVLRQGYNKIAEHTDKLDAIEFNDTPEDGDINWGALSQRPTTKVTGSSYSVNNSITAQVPGMKTSASGGWGSTDSENHFYREGENNTLTKTSTQQEKSYSLGGEVDGVGVEFGLTDTDIANHANSDNDGQYRNISVTFKNFPRMAKLRSGLAKDLQTMQSAFRGVTDPMGMCQLGLGMIIGFVKNRLATMSPVEMSSWKKFKSGLGSDDTGFYSNSSFTAELNFIRDGDRNDENGSWNMQYFRMSAGGNAGFKWDEEATLATLYGVADVNGYTNGSAGVDAGVGMFEVLGNNTASYVITVYNGLVYTQEEVDAGFATDRFARWNDYRTTHLMGIKGLINNIGNPDSVPHKEVMGAYKNSQSDALVAQATQAAESGTVSGSALQAFENFLYENYKNKRKSDSAVAGSTGEFDSQSDSRTPWYQSVGGSSKVYIDMANQSNAVLKRSQYKPERQAPTKPNTLLDSLYQEQKIDLELYLSKRETAGIFTSGGGDILETRSFSLAKGTAPEAAIGKVAKNLRAELSSPEDFNIGLINGPFAPTNLPTLWNNYWEVKNRPTRGSAARIKSRDLAARRTTFTKELEPAMEAVATHIVKTSQIQEAGSDVTVDEGYFWDTEKLNVGN